jgi:hypothetical protein
MKIKLPVNKNKFVITEVEVSKNTQLDVINFSFNRGPDGDRICYILEGDVSGTILIPPSPTPQQQVKINKLGSAIEEFVDFDDKKAL